MVEIDGLEAGLPRTVEAGCIGAVGDDECDRGIEPVVANGIDDRLKVAAPSGDEHSKPAVIGVRPRYDSVRHAFADVRAPSWPDVLASRKPRRFTTFSIGVPNLRDHLRPLTITIRRQF